MCWSLHLRFIPRCLSPSGTLLMNSNGIVGTVAQTTIQKVALAPLPLVPPAQAVTVVATHASALQSLLKMN